MVKLTGVAPDLLQSALPPPSASLLLLFSLISPAILAASLSLTLWMTSLMQLDLSRCMKVTDSGIKHLLSLSQLQKLHLSQTGVTADGVKLLSALRNLSTLDLGGLPVFDLALSSLQVLTNLEYLDVWGSEISDEGAAALKNFPKLS